MGKGTDQIGVAQPSIEVASALEEVLRMGARDMLSRAVEHEVVEYIERHAEVRDDSGRRLVVRNGHSPERELVTGIGPIPVRQPRVHDRRPEQKFSSQILVGSNNSSPSKTVPFHPTPSTITAPLQSY